MANYRPLVLRSGEIAQLLDTDNLSAGTQCIIKEANASSAAQFIAYNDLNEGVGLGIYGSSISSGIVLAREAYLATERNLNILGFGGVIKFGTSFNVERMRIAAGVNIGGTADPGAYNAIIGPAPASGSLPSTRLLLLTNASTATQRMLSFRSGNDQSYGFDWMLDDATTGDLSLQRVLAGTSTHVLTIARASGGVNIGGTADPGAGNLAINAYDYATGNSEFLAQHGIFFRPSLGFASESNRRNLSVTVSAGTSGTAADALDINAYHHISLFTGAAERMRVFISGGVNIGGTADPGASNLEVAGFIRAGGNAGYVNQAGDIVACRPSNTATGVYYFGNNSSRYFYYDGTNYNLPGGSLIVNGTTYTSSRKVKKNIRDWTPTSFKKLRPRLFERIENPGIKELGFVAEEIKEDLPEAYREGGGDAADTADEKAAKIPGIDPMAIIAKHEAHLQYLENLIEELKQKIK